MKDLPWFPPLRVFRKCIYSSHFRLLVNVPGADINRQCQFHSISLTLLQILRCGSLNCPGSDTHLSFILGYKYFICEEIWPKVFFILRCPLQVLNFRMSGLADSFSSSVWPIINNSMCKQISFAKTFNSSLKVTPPLIYPHSSKAWKCFIFLVFVSVYSCNMSIHNLFIIRFLLFVTALIQCFFKAVVFSLLF